MVHEFRTPLSTSLMFLQNLLLQANLPTSTRKVLIVIASQINLLISLVNDTLDLHLIEKGRFRAKNEIFRPADTLEFISAMLMP